jgi:hypothetical protein
VRVTLDHGESLVTADALHGRQVDARLDEVRNRCVSKGVTDDLLRIQPRSDNAADVSGAPPKRESPFRPAKPCPGGKAVGRHRLNPRLIKIHRNYTVDELGRTLKVHKNTVRAWVKHGLPTIDRNRPMIIHGRDAKRFLEDRRRRAKQPCPPGHFFCLRCRAPKIPAGAMVDYLPLNQNF